MRFSRSRKEVCAHTNIDFNTREKEEKENQQKRLKRHSHGDFYVLGWRMCWKLNYMPFHVHRILLERQRKSNDFLKGRTNHGQLMASFPRNKGKTWKHQPDVFKLQPIPSLRPAAKHRAANNFSFLKGRMSDQVSILVRQNRNVVGRIVVLIIIFKWKAFWNNYFLSLRSYYLVKNLSRT